jgi:hypothetical protein
MEEEDFDPLVFSIPRVMREEITNRQKGISSEWPLIMTPAAVGLVGDKELYERGIVQVQISNAVQMGVNMLLKGDFDTSLLFLLDAYSLSTATATAINNERIVLQYPGSGAILNGDETEFVRPKVKDLFSAYKSSASVKSFFLWGEGVNILSGSRKGIIHGQDESNGSPRNSTLLKRKSLLSRTTESHSRDCVPSPRFAYFTEYINQQVLPRSEVSLQERKHQGQTEEQQRNIQKSPLQIYKIGGKTSIIGKRHVEEKTS